MRIFCLVTTMKPEMTAHFGGIMGPYLDLVWALINKGRRVESRNAPTRQLFGQHLSFDLAAGFPLLQRRRMAWRWTVAELCWFLSGSTDLSDLQAMGCRWWDAWADWDGGEDSVGRVWLGLIYGHQLRSCNGPDRWGHYEKSLDQLRYAIDALKESPTTRRAIISLWHGPDVPDMALPPCHGIHIQFSLATGRLDLLMTQRSADVGVGLPVNVASYALLARMVAHELGVALGHLHITIGDAHLYESHVEAARELLQRAAPERDPELHINPDMPRDIDAQWKALAGRLRAGEPIGDVLVLQHYTPGPKIEMELIP